MSFCDSCCGDCYKGRKKRNIPETETIDFIDEESRKNIYIWSEKRSKKERGSYWYHCKIYLIDWTLIKTFLDGITLMVLIGVLLTAVATFICQKYGISFNFQVSMAISPLIFPLSFLIRGDFQRRERALDLLADFRSASYSLFLICREWKDKVGVSDEDSALILNKLIQLMVHVREYLQTSDISKQEFIVQVIYEDMSDLSQLLEMFHNQKVNAISALMSRLHVTNQQIITSFERLRTIRDYRSPRSARSFAKIMMFLTPILFSPLFVFMGNVVTKTSSWTPIVFGMTTSFIFGCLQSVQDRLDDPFLGVTYDEINLDDLHSWASESLKRNAQRNYKTGRFFVKTAPPKQMSQPGRQSVGLEDLNAQVGDTRPAEKVVLNLLMDATGDQTIRYPNSHMLTGRGRVFFMSQKEPADSTTVTQQEPSSNIIESPPLKKDDKHEVP